MTEDENEIEVPAAEVAEVQETVAAEVEREQRYAGALARIQPGVPELMEMATQAATVLHVASPTVKELHTARMPLKNARLAIERSGKELKEDALAFTRAVSGRVRELVGIIAPVEDEIEERQRALEAAEREAKENARRAALERAQGWCRAFAEANGELHIADALESTDEWLGQELERARAAWQENQRIAAEENARRLAEQEAERARAAAEREALRAERDRLAHERAAREREIEAERAAERAEMERRERLLEQQQAELRAEQQRVAAERAAAERAEREKREREERERIRLANAPHAERVRELAKAVAGLGDFDDEAVSAILLRCNKDLVDHAKNLEAGLAVGPQGAAQ